MTDASVLRELADLRSKVDTLMRKSTPSLGMGIGVSTSNSSLNFRTTQMGFAAEITQSYSATTGYSWKVKGVRKNPNLELYDPPIQLTGEDAYPINGDETWQTGDTIWVEPDVEASYYLCFKIDGGNSPPPAPCNNCAWFAGATEYDCWTLTVLGAGGNMASVDTAQSLSLTWVEDAAFYDGGYWESDDDFTICDFTGLVQLYRDDEGEPQLYLVDPDVILSLSCCDTASQTLYFSGGNSGNRVLCCTRQVNDGPTSNLFTLAVQWTRCPIVANPSYDGAGWYCVAAFACDQSRQCCYLTEDPGIAVILCSGPHDSAETCADLCASPSGPPSGPPVEDDCGTWPRTIYAYFHDCTGTAACLNGLTIPLVYGAISPGLWGAVAGGGCAYGLSLGHDPFGSGCQWGLNNSGTTNFSLGPQLPSSENPFLMEIAGTAFDLVAHVECTLTE